MKESYCRIISFDYNNTFKEIHFEVGMVSKRASYISNFTFHSYTYNNSVITKLRCSGLLRELKGGYKI